MSMEILHGDLVYICVHHDLVYIYITVGRNNDIMDLIRDSIRGEIFVNSPTHVDWCPSNTLNPSYICLVFMITKWMQKIYIVKLQE